MSLKTTTLVLNRPTRCQATASPFRTIDLHQVIQEDRQVLIQVIPMVQEVREDEDLRQEM